MFSLPEASTTQSNTSALPTLAASLLLRLAFFGLCRAYVQRLLVADLQQVADEDDGANHTPSRGSYELLDASRNGQSPSASRTRRSGYASDSDASSHSTTRDKRLADVESGSSAKASIASANWAGLMSTTTFCCTFSESCTLCTLVLTANITGERARWLNWTISTTALLSIILIIVPFLQCLMVAKRNKGMTTPVLLATLVLFVLYEIVFRQSGLWLSRLVGIEAGSHTFGYVDDALRQICVPGVLLIAGLSGAGAVNTAWNAYEWRQRFRGTPVTEMSVGQLEQSLKKAREDRLQRQAELNAATAASAGENTQPSFISRFISSDPKAASLASLRSEIFALQSLEGQLLQDIQSMEQRRRTLELSGTFKGRALALVGYLFTFYCVARVVLSAVSLLFGLDREAAPNSDSGAAGEEPRSQNLSHLLAAFISIVGLNVDVATWSRLVSLALIGVIILVNMRVVLSSVYRAFKIASSSGGAPFVLLFLSQLMAVYLLTSLISLPDSGNSGSKELLRTLPDFGVFTRLFDGVFVTAAGSAAAFRYVQKKMRAEDITSTSVV